MAYAIDPFYKNQIDDALAARALQSFNEALSEGDDFADAESLVA